MFQKKWQTLEGKTHAPKSNIFLYKFIETIAKPLNLKAAQEGGPVDAQDLQELYE